MWEEHLSMWLRSPGLIKSDAVPLNSGVKMIEAICYFWVSPRGNGQGCGAGERFNVRLKEVQHRGGCTDHGMLWHANQSHQLTGVGKKKQTLANKHSYTCGETICTAAATSLCILSCLDYNSELSRKNNWRQREGTREHSCVHSHWEIVIEKNEILSALVTWDSQKTEELEKKEISILSPESKKGDSWWSSGLRLRLNCVEFTWSPCVCVGFTWELWFLHAGQSHAH